MATSSGLTRATRSIPGKTTRSRATSLAMVSPTAFGTLLNRSLIFAFHIRRYFGRPRRQEAPDCSSRSDRAPHVANFAVEMIGGGGFGRADQKILDARIDHDPR